MTTPDPHPTDATHRDRRRYLPPTRRTRTRCALALLFVTLAGCVSTQEAGWLKASSEDSIESYSIFLGTFPESPHAEEARQRLETQLAELAWAEARERDAPAAYRAFLERHPTSPRADDARARIRILEGAAGRQ